MTEPDASTTPGEHAPGPALRRYVAGFMIDTDGRVALIRKNRPEWQAGQLNGIGGKVEAGETHADAMRREFREEAGVAIDNWFHYATVDFGEGAVRFYRVFVHPETLDLVRSCTDEIVETHPVSVAADHNVAMIPNLRWLIPLAAYTHDTYEVVVATETGPPPPG